MSSTYLGTWATFCAASPRRKVLKTWQRGKLTSSTGQNRSFLKSDKSFALLTILGKFAEKNSWTLGKTASNFSLVMKKVNVSPLLGVVISIQHCSLSHTCSVFGFSIELSSIVKVVHRYGDAVLYRVPGRYPGMSCFASLIKHSRTWELTPSHPNIKEASTTFFEPSCSTNHNLHCWKSIFSSLNVKMI